MWLFSFHHDGYSFFNGLLFSKLFIINYCWHKLRALNQWVRCQVYHSFHIICWNPGGHHAHEHSGLKGCVFYKHAVWGVRSMRTKTHTNNWCWVITRECRMVHQHSIRQTSWIFISLFILPVQEMRQKVIPQRCVGGLQRHTLTQAQKHRLTFTDININTLQHTWDIRCWTNSSTRMLLKCSMRYTWQRTGTRWWTLNTGFI